MTPQEFCYWLQGYFELATPAELNTSQTELIERHLAMVFEHSIDTSYGSKEKQEKLKNLHNPYSDVRC